MTSLPNPIATLVAAMLLAGAAACFLVLHQLAPAVMLVIAGVLLPSALRIAREWERSIVLRAGKLQGVRGPGLFWIIPIVDSVAGVVDLRIQTTPIATEKTLTRDTSPVDVDAIVFWMVHDPRQAILALVDYASAISLVSQTSLREVIGANDLRTLLEDRRGIDTWLREAIAEKTQDWGITVQSVEIRDVTLPANLQDAMSRQAQAEREKSARVTLASAERLVAAELEEAARTYNRSPTALQILQINRLYEMNKDRGATILIPTSMADSMARLLSQVPDQSPPPEPPAPV